MSLNIKNPEANRLARELASLTGESMTEAVTASLRERLTRIENERRREEQIAVLLQIAHECALHLDPAFKSEDHAEMLYDELGLPK